MTTNNPHFHTDASLSPEERGEMRHEFMAFMDENPVVAKREQILSPYFPHLVRVPALIATALLVVTGTAYAAEQSLPNDLLYPVKTAVIEPVFIEGLAFSDNSKARAQRTLVDRRLVEAEELIERNEMNPEAATKIAAAVEKHATAVGAFVAKMSQEGDLSDALNAGTDLENTLEAHGDVLASIVDGEPSTAEIYDLIDRVSEHANTIENAGEVIEEQAVTTSPEETSEYISQAAAEVEAIMAEVREGIATVPATEALHDDAASLLTASEASLAAGNAQLAEGKLPEALPLIRDALQGVEQAAILLESSEEIEGE